MEAANGRIYQVPGCLENLRGAEFLPKRNVEIPSWWAASDKPAHDYAISHILMIGDSTP
jgi:hypothetical protein